MTSAKTRTVGGEIVPTGVLMHLKAHQIKPSQHNPRHLFDVAELQALKASIKEKGVLVPITVYQPRGQSKYSILDGERRFRCVLELTEEGHRDKQGQPLEIPANVVEPPSKIAGLLYMFNIHNFREAWELMPTALGLKIVMEELATDDTTELTKLTGLSDTQVERCKKLLAFPEKYQRLSLDPDPKTRVPSNFWIEALPVLDLIKVELPKLHAELGRDRITDKLVDKYRAKKIKSVIHFRRIMEGYELSANEKALREAVLRRIEEFILRPDLETRSAFDEFVVDKRRARNALNLCSDFVTSLQNLRLSYTTDDADRKALRESLKEVESYCKSLIRALEGGDDPEVAEAQQQVD